MPAWLIFSVELTLNKSGNIVFAKICNTRLGVIALPIYSDEKHNYSITDNAVDDSVRTFTIEAFVDIYLDSLEIRTAIFDGNYTFYRDNLIPSSWTLLNSEGLNTALKKIEDMPTAIPLKIKSIQKQKTNLKYQK